MVFQERDYLLAFSAFFLFGPQKLNLLFKHFQTAEKAWQAPQHLVRRLNLGEKTTDKFLLFRKRFNLERYLEQIEKGGIKTLTLKDSSYPKILREIPSAPPVLYLKTRLSLPELFGKPTLAVIGTRQISSYGRTVTQKLVGELVGYKITVVSGLARGVDVCAHETTLAHKGLTIAVLGSAVDRIYPSSHLRISQEIENQGAVISEFPPGTTALPGNFVIRNRIISGLSLGVLITEAAKKSGTMITASYAADQGREVFAVPGPITSVYSEGTSSLLQKGAKLVTSASDILEELPGFDKLA